MRVAIDYRPVTAAPYSGIAKQVLAMEQALLAAGHTVLRMTEAPLQHAHRSLCLCPDWPNETHGLHRPTARWRFEACFLPKALASHAVDVYIATANMGLPVSFKPVPYLRMLLLHDVFQLTAHNRHQSRLKKALYRAIDWLSIWFSVRSADRILTPSQFSADEIQRLFPAAAGKIAVLPNAVSYSPLQAPARPADLEAPYWLLVGTREPRKNITWFIEQWWLARQRHANIPDLVLVGSVADLPPHQQSLPGIHIKQQLSEAALNTLYYHAHMLWQPSYAEGFGLPVIEAMAQGTPVAVATGSALDEVASPDSDRFSPQDGTALVQLMISRADYQTLHAPAARATLQAWAQQFDHTHYQQRLLALINDTKGRR